MATLNQQDIDVRLQLSACCAGDLGDTMAKAFMYGKSCADKHLRDLQVLVGYIESVSCYKIITDETLATATVTIGTNAGGETLTLKINSNQGLITLGSATWATSNNATGAALATSINAGTATHGYTASNNSGVVTITAATGTGSYPNGLALSKTGTMAVTLTDIAGGVDEVKDDDGTNCLTEKQVNDIFEAIEEICELCFAAPGTSYASQYESSSTRITEQAATRITEDSVTRITEQNDLIE